MRNLFFLTLAILYVRVGHANTCFEYEPKLATIAGTLNVKYYPGPPNFEDVNKGDAKEGALIVDVDSLFCVKGNPEDELNKEDLNNQRELQLVILKDALWPIINRNKGKKITVTGMLFQAMTGHHRTEVLMTLEKVSE